MTNMLTNEFDEFIHLLQARYAHEAKNIQSAFEKYEIDIMKRKISK